MLVGADKRKIIEIGSAFAPKRKQRHVFGDGGASEKIVKIMGIYNEDCRDHALTQRGYKRIG